jgi:hypothetical protein
VIRNAEKPITVSGDDSVYVIPVYAIRWARLIDPELTAGGGAIGFRMVADADDDPDGEPSRAQPES